MTETKQCGTGTDTDSQTSAREVEDPGEDTCTGVATPLIKASKSNLRAPKRQPVHQMVL